MGEEVRMSEYDATANGCSDGGDDERVHEWEMGLPTGEDLTPLSQLLIPPELASAFSISPEPHRTLLDVSRASQKSFSHLRSGFGQLSSNNFKPFSDDPTQEPTIVEADGSGSESRKSRKVVMESEEADSAIRTAENSVDDQSGTRTTVKRPRLVWTPQLHKRFVDVVSHLGIKNAVPKTIMQLMNVEGLTRENVASHLQKYRLYLKRMQGLSSEGPSSSDPLFASTPLPQENGNGVANGGNGHGGIPAAGQYHGGHGGMMAMHHPVYGMGNQGGQAVMHHGGGGYGMVQGREWSGSNYGYHSHHHHHHHHHHPHHVAPNDNM